MLLKYEVINEKIFKDDTRYYHWGIWKMRLSRWTLSIMMLFIFVCSPCTNSFAFDTIERISHDSITLIIPDYLNDWHVKKNNTIHDAETYPSGCTQEQAITIEPYSNQPSYSRDGPMDSPWPMVLHDVRHTAQSLLSTANNHGAELWRVRGDETGAVESSAVIDNTSIIYFGTMGADGSLYALYPNGTLKWKFIIDGMIWSTPAIAEDGTIYVPTWGGYPPYLYALYPNGTLKWTFGLYTTSSPAIGNNGTIYIGDDNKFFYAINPDGTEQWRYTTGDFIQSSPAIADDGTIYVGSADTYLYAFHPNGTLRWRYKTGGWIKSDPSIGADGTIYIPAFDGNLYAVNPNGTLKWSTDAGNEVIPRAVAIATDGTLYVGTEALRAFYPNNGTVKWSCDIGGQMYGTFPAISADGTIYVSAGGSLVAVNPDGTERWRKQLTIAQIHSSPSIGPDDRVYVGSEDYGLSAYGYLHAFGPQDPNAPTAPTITGQTNGRIKRTYDYTFTSTSSLGNQIYYQIDWGDGTTTDWLGPYTSGESLTMEHSWSEQGTYNITARAKDTDNRWGPWGKLEVTMPKNKDLFMMRPLLNWLLERFPNSFPILRYLFGFNQ